MERVEVETIGEVIQNRMFLPLVALTVISLSQLLVMSFGGYWPVVCLQLDGALFGLIGGVYTMAIGTTTLVISWLLVDDCSWFFKCSMLFSSAVLFIVCGIFYFYSFFEAYECLPKDLDKSEPFLNMSSLYELVRKRNLSGYRPEYYNTDYVELSEILYVCYDRAPLDEASAWSPILIVICVFLGVLYLMFAVYLFISLDEG